MRNILQVLLATLALTLTVSAWESEGKWVDHVLEPDGHSITQTIGFSLPDYIERKRRSKIPQWNHFANGPREATDYFQVVFGGHTAGILKATERDLGRSSSHQEMNEELRRRTLQRIERYPNRYKVLKTGSGTKQGVPISGILFKERHSDPEVAQQRAMLEKVLASLPREEREREIQKNLGVLASKEVYHYVLFRKGEKINITLNFSTQERAKKEAIAEKFLESIKFE